MTDEEVNKIIAEYMNTKVGSEVKNNYAGPDTIHHYIMDKNYHTISDKWYTESIDALIPVWKKLYKNHHSFIKDFHIENNFVRLETAIGLNDSKTDLEYVDTYSKGTSIEQAAAKATAKTISFVTKIRKHYELLSKR